jgi:hypothetical protein
LPPIDALARTAAAIAATLTAIAEDAYPVDMVLAGRLELLADSARRHAGAMQQAADLEADREAERELAR